MISYNVQDNAEIITKGPIHVFAAKFIVIFILMVIMKCAFSHYQITETDLLLAIITGTIMFSMIFLFDFTIKVSKSCPEILIGIAIILLLSGVILV